MSRNKKPRKTYKPRQIMVNTLEIVLHKAAKPAPEDRAEVLAKLQEAIAALCAGVATEMDWSVAAGAVSVAMAIERQGVVRGLQAHLINTETLLQVIYDRCRLPQMWLRPTLSFEEVEALKLFYELHAFQVEQLGRGELLAAIDKAAKQTIAQGQQVTLVRDIERMAA